MGMQTNDYRITVLDTATKIFNLIGIDIRRCHLNSSWEIQDRGLFIGGLPYVIHGIANFNGEVHFGASKTLRRVLEYPFCFRRSLCATLHLASTGHSNVNNASLISLKNFFALHRGR